jgi:osmotically-inducible protein OsmY
MSQKTDERITQDVLDELAWDPAFTLADLSVSTDRGRVRLYGTASTFGTKLEAENAAYRVGGVTSVDNHIVVDPAALDLRSDADIADDIRCALELDYKVPDEWLSVRVIDGIATLAGNVDWSYQRDAAEDDAAMILGVRGLVNEITVNQSHTPRCGRDGSREKLLNDLRDLPRTRPQSQVSVVEDVELRVRDQAMHDLRIDEWDKRVVIAM